MGEREMGMIERVACTLFLREQFGSDFNDPYAREARYDCWHVLPGENFNPDDYERVNEFSVVYYQTEDYSYAAYGKNEFRDRAKFAIDAALSETSAPPAKEL